MAYRSAVEVFKARDLSIKRKQIELTHFMVGRTITGITVAPHNEACDGENMLTLKLDDGTVVQITGSYGEYTGFSCDEYLEKLTVKVTSP